MKKENKLIVAVVVLSFLIGVFFDQRADYKLSTMHFLVLTALIVTYNVVLVLQRAEWERRKTVFQYSIMGFFAIGMIQGVCLIRQREEVSSSLSLGLGLVLAAILMASFLILLKTEKGVTENVIMLVIFASFLLRVFYVVLTSSWLFQNDITTFYEGCHGHLGYIYLIYTNGRLPDIDPAVGYQLYHPPLHHIICALFLKLLEAMRLLPESVEALEETLQVLPLIYSTVTIVFIYKTVKQMKLSMEGQLMAVCLTGFMPYSVMLGGALNNDPLTTMLMVMCIYFTFKWYEKPDMKGILIMALCIGGAMMTKISAGLIAPAMAVMMLHRAWKDRKQWTVYLKQFVCFGLIAFPLGLWYSVYCFVKWKTPLGFIPALSEESEQFIGEYDKWSRFFDFDRAFEFLAIRMDYVNDFADYNIPAALIKYATFGESRYYQACKLTHIVGTGIFWVNAALFILMAITFVAWCFFRDGREIQKDFIFIGAAVSVYSYLKFCIRYPHVCTMSVRYIMTAVYMGCIVIAATSSVLQEKLAGKNERAGRICKKIMIAAPVFYAIAVVTLKMGMELTVH